MTDCKKRPVTDKPIAHEDIWKEYQQNALSHSAIHYMLTIESLKESKGYVRLTDLARELDISPGSCHTTLAKLKKTGMVEEDENRFLTLSQTGTQIAFQIQQNHQTLYTFFRFIGVSERQARTDACKMEHLISPETIAHLTAFQNLYTAHHEVLRPLIQQLATRPNTDPFHVDPLSKFCRVHAALHQEVGTPPQS
ncbi:MAG: metal-dependent transcriptional regulator [Patescibacteria group bacterium]